MRDNKKLTILVTGGCGYIGSHTVVRLLETGNHVIVLDNLSNSNPDVIKQVVHITGCRPEFICGDIRDRGLLKIIFARYEIDAVIHFAGLKAISESLVEPLEYYDNNVSGSLVLLEEMNRAKVKRFVFSSSATVYRESKVQPVREDFLLGASNPYGHSKLMVESMLADLQHSDRNWSIARLRYFNPVGAHVSGLIGEDPRGVPSNLFPYIAQVAVGKRKVLSVFGNDYPTIDGTGVRDYIHVMDLADGHLAALDVLLKGPTMITVNLGTGRGYSVLEVIRAFEKASGRSVPFQIVDRRPGDIAEAYAATELATKLLNWTAQLDLARMCSDAWRWQVKNLKGFESTDFF